MSLRHALLGLLSTGPASGYDLTKTFEGDFGRYAWYAAHPQIYSELGRLADGGLVAVAEEGARGRRTYEITDAGLTELRSWLANPPDRSRMRNEYVLRSFLLPALGYAGLREQLLARIEETERDIAEIRAAAEKLDRRTTPGQSLPFGRVAAEFGVRMSEAYRGWAQWTLDHLVESEPE